MKPRLPLRILAAVVAVGLLAAGVAVIVRGAPSVSAEVFSTDVAVGQASEDIDVVGGGRGVDDVAAVGRSGRLVESPRVVSGSGDGLECLTGDSAVGDGCVVAQLQPRVTAPSQCVGLGGEFFVRIGSVNGSGLVSFSYEVSAQGGVVPSALVADGKQGETYSWAFSPTAPTTGCPAVSEGSWRTFRVDVVRAGVEESFGFGPVRVGLSSGSATLRVASTKVGLVSGSTQVGLAYRSPGGVGYVSRDPTATLPGGWSLDGLGELAPWVSATQAGSGAVPAAVVLTAFDGQQVQFTNTLAGTGAVGGAWAPPTQAGWPSGQFGSLVDSGDLTAADSTLTWSSGQQVVTFAKTSPGVWSVVESRQVEPAGLAAASVSAVWDTSVSPARLSRLVDPASNKRVSFTYGSSGSCGGVMPPTDGSDVYLAPDGLLCGWENFDGRTTNVWYSTVADDVDPTDAYQVGWVVGPGGVNTQLAWTSDGGLSWPQLTSAQTPLGHDAQADGLAESDSIWVVNYDPFGNVASVVSPKPGVDKVVSGANTDRVARAFTYNDSQGVQWTTVSHGVLADQDEPSSVTAGATLIDEVRFDGAWRPVRYAVASSRPNTTDEFFFVNKTWDTVHDRLLATEGPNGRQRVTAYDYLGRVINRWGPAPVDAFTTNADGQVVPATGFGDQNLITSSSSYDADTAGTLAGLTVSMFAGSTPGGVPAASLGSCAEGQCPDPDSPPLTWTQLPDAANVSGGGWSMNAIALREAPVDGGQLRYRVATDANGSATLYANGSCTAVFTAASCSTTVAPAPSTQSGEPVALQVQYVRDATSVSAQEPVTVTIEESTDGGQSWSALIARDLDPGFGLTSSNSQADTFSQGGGVETILNSAVFSDPQRQQTSTVSLNAGGVAASMGHTYEPYDGTSTWGRVETTTDLAGTTVAATYWGPNETTTNPCDGTTSSTQAGLQATFTTAETTTGDPNGSQTQLVHDLAGRRIARTLTSQNGAASSTVCRSYDDRDQLVSVATSDATLSTSFTYPWSDPTSTDPFTTSASHTAPDTTGTSRTYTSANTVDLLGRRVSSTDAWGTTTVNDYRVDPTTGVRTTIATTTTAAGFTLTQTTTVNADGTIAEVTRADGSTTIAAAYAYNADATIDMVTISTLDETGGSTEIVTETRSYQPTTGIHIGSTWTRGATTIAADQLTDAPNALRVLGETLTVDGVTYTWDYTYGGLSRLTDAELTSSDNSVAGTWSYAFVSDTGAEDGENPDAHLNGNITSKTVTANGGPADTVEYHYDFADRLTRTTDPQLAGLIYDDFGNLTRVGANTITYNTTNAPVRVTDGTTTVAYTRLIDYSILERSTTTGSDDPVTTRYSHNGIILDPAGQTLLQIHQFGPVTVTTPNTPDIDTSYQINTLRGNRLLTLDATGTPTSTTPSMFDPYGNPITAPSTGNAGNPSVPDYAWRAVNDAETETLELPYVMMGARVYLPELGRFTSPDPRPGVSGSEYSYARSDPINYHDPDGFSPKAFRAFGHWFDDAFSNLWKHDLKKPFSQMGTWIHDNAGVIAVTAILVTLIVISVVLAFVVPGLGEVADAALLDDVAAGGSEELAAGGSEEAAAGGSERAPLTLEDIPTPLTDAVYLEDSLSPLDEVDDEDDYFDRRDEKRFRRFIERAARKNFALPEGDEYP